MTPKQQAVIAYLSERIRSSRVSMMERKQEYQFHIVLPKGVTHCVRFDSREFNQSTVPHLLTLCANNEIAKAIAIAPFALDILFQNGTAHASPRAADI